MKLAYVVLLAAAAAAPSRAGDAAKPKTIYLAVLDFASTPASAGQKLADTLRVRLRRHEGYEVVSGLETREVARGLPVSTDPAKVRKLMADQLGVHVALYGSVERLGAGLAARVRCVDLTDPKKPGGWMKEFRDPTERARAVLSKQIVEEVRAEGEWQPPEYGDEPEPKSADWGKPINVNGAFENGALGWERADNAATFLTAGPAGRGTVLKITTNLERAPWMAYRRKLRFGQADPARPPKIGKDDSYASVAGMEGVHFHGDWIDAKPGQRYWLLADMKGKTAGIFFPKIFVKGYLDCSAHATALPEHSLVERRMTAGQFADLPETKRKALVAADAKQHPERYRRECFRWYLSCRNEENVWKHYAAPFPPRGGLPANVQWFRVVIYAYWPPGDFVFDNVILHADPRQKTPLPEEKPRSEFFKKGGIQPQPD